MQPEHLLDRLVDTERDGSHGDGAEVVDGHPPEEAAEQPGLAVGGRQHLQSAPSELGDRHLHRRLFTDKTTFLRTESEY